MHCPVCSSQKMVFLRKVLGQRTKKKLFLYLCLDCRSLYNPSSYKEDDEQLKRDLEWCKAEYEWGKSRSEIVVKECLKIHPNAKKLLDVGAAIGTTVQIANEIGLQANGVECNPYATRYAEERYGVKLRCTHFNRETYSQQFDIIIISHVLEHLDELRLLFNDAICSLSKNGIIYVSVPFVEIHKHWRYILFPQQQGTPFFDNDVHKVHISTKGLNKMAKEFGAKETINLLREDWDWWSGGFIFRF